MALRELVASFGFDIEGKPLKDLQSSIDTAKAGMVALVAAAATSAFGLFEVVKRTADAGDHALKLSQRVGTTAEAIQKLTYAAALSDVSSEELGTSLTFLNRKMFEASQGSAEAQKAFRDAGVQYSHLKGLTADEAFLKIADGLAGIQDPSRKAAAAIGLFSRQGARLLPLVKDGASGIRELMVEGEQLGTVMSNEDAQAAEDFNDELRRLSEAFRGIKQQVGVAFLRPFKEIVMQAREFLKANREVIKSNLSAWVKGMQGYLMGLFGALKAVAESIAGWVSLFGGAETAVKLFLGAIGVLGGVAILSAIGQFAVALKGLAVAAMSLDLATLKFTLIGAAILLLGVALEDVATYFAGGDSITGRMLESFTAWADGMYAKYGILREIAQVFRDIAKGASDLGKIFSMYGGDSVMGVLTATRSEDDSNQRSAIETARSGLKYQRLTSNQALGRDEAFSRDLRGGGPSGMSVENYFTVTVPQGTPPAQVSGALEKGARDGVNDGWNEAWRSFGGVR